MKKWIKMLSRQQLISEHATLSFLTWSQFYKLYKQYPVFQHSFAGAFYFTVDIELSDEMLTALTDSIKKILESDTKIEFVKINRLKLIEMFREKGLMDKVSLLKYWCDYEIDCIKCDGFIDYMLEPHSLDRERLKLFELMKFKDGFLLRFPNITNPTKIEDFKEPKLLYKMVTEYNQFIKSIGIDTVSKLNRLIYDVNINDIRLIVENYHEKRINEIATSLCNNFANKKVISIAGPSSSNKTTFAKRLALALKGNGYNSIVIETDDYFHNEKDIPYEDDGERDWESIKCLNVELLGKRIKQLVQGETIPRRRYDWSTSTSYDDPKEEMKLKENCFLIVEGIHGLNPKLLNELGSEIVTPIYVQALSPLKLDNNHRFPSSDLRLIRRITRDYFFRGRYPPRSTLERWTSVRIGEMNNIFPYQENAEYFFNSSLVYEVSVLGVYAKSLLSEATVAPDDKPNDDASTSLSSDEAVRLQRLISFFSPLSSENTPRASCIREFIGNSDLRY